MASGSVDVDGGGSYAWDTAFFLVKTNFNGNKATTAYNDLFDGS